MENPSKVYYNFRNGLALLVKNWPLSALIFLLPLRILLDYLAAIIFILKGSPKPGWAVIKAHLHSIAHVIKNLKKRNKYKLMGFHVPNALTINKVIVIQYFLLSRRKYPEIKNPR
jgi:hypothetical protein